MKFYEVRLLYIIEETYYLDAPTVADAIEATNGVDHSWEKTHSITPIVTAIDRTTVTCKCEHPRHLDGIDACGVIDDLPQRNRHGWCPCTKYVPKS